MIGSVAIQTLQDVHGVEKGIGPEDWPSDKQFKIFVAGATDQEQCCSFETKAPERRTEKEGDVGCIR